MRPYVYIEKLTADFADSHLKKRVKKGGSLPSMTIYIGASRDKFCRRKSCSINFCTIPKNKLKIAHLVSEILERKIH